MQLSLYKVKGFNQGWVNPYVSYFNITEQGLQNIGLQVVAERPVIQRHPTWFKASQAKSATEPLQVSILPLASPQPLGRILRPLHRCLATTQLRPARSNPSTPVQIPAGCLSSSARQYQHTRLITVVFLTSVKMTPSLSHPQETGPSKGLRRSNALRDVKEARSSWIPSPAFGQVHPGAKNVYQKFQRKNLVSFHAIL